MFDVPASVARTGMLTINTCTLSADPNDYVLQDTIPSALLQERATEILQLTTAQLAVSSGRTMTLSPGVFARRN